MVTRLWFRAKRYGWGWTPCTWEGWAVTLADLAALTGWVAYAASHGALILGRGGFVILMLPIFALAALLALICWRKGERPRWRWGK